MNVMVGAMRGFGSSLSPMMASIFGVWRPPCGVDLHHLPPGPHLLHAVPVLPGHLGGHLHHRGGVLLVIRKKAIARAMAPDAGESVSGHGPQEA